MSDKLAVVFLDALGPRNIYQFDGFQAIRQRYRTNGEVLGISTLPHTACSHPLIWGGYDNGDKFWVDAEGWIDPAMHFEHRGHYVEGADQSRNYTRDDYPTAFIWDVLDEQGYDPVAIQVPIVLPPFSYNADRVQEDAWFPDTPERMHTHVREKPEIVIEHARAGYDFIASSIQMPDKWLHGIAEGKHGPEFMHSEAEVLDTRMEVMVETFEREGYDWIIAGDHGSPHPGVMPVHEAKEMLPRHRKEAVIFGSEGLDLPTYTDQFHDWLLEYFDVDDLAYEDLEIASQERPETSADVEQRLENLGYR